MKVAYGVLGIAFIVVFGVAYVFLAREAEAPESEVPREGDAAPVSEFILEGETEIDISATTTPKG